uniref:Transcription factor domain-containing protein n=1 Tax=Bionectria ochroleuca TaxID=29856 RepID=A0A8H7TMC5_BIOOC
MNVVIHLLDLFYRRSNSNVKEVVPLEAAFFYLVRTKTVFSGLIYAMCACAVQYSTHPMARATMAGGQQSLDETFSKLARVSIHDWAETDRHLDYLRTYCILIDYDAAKCHGKQAWANISISKTLLQLYRAQTQPPLDEVGILERIEFYLQIKEATHSLGHGALESSVLSQTVAWASHNSDYTQVGSEQRLLDLLRFFVRIHNYNNKNNPKAQVVQPWKSGSDFRTLHTEMEEYTVHFPSTPSLDENDTSQDDIEYTITEAMCSLVCHCCDIALNLRFLPIPEPNNGQGIGSLSTCVEFPGAPPLFILERRSRCEASAEAICRIAQDVVQGGGFFHYTALLGYCSVHAIFVLLNQLHRQPKHQQLGKVVGSLKFAFTLLAAVRRFYAPAASWLEIVFRAHDTSTPLTHHRSTIGEAFHSYLGRYVDVPEPCFVPLMPSADQSDILGSKAKEAQASPDESVGRGVLDVSERQNDESQQPAWVQSYAGHLSEDIEAEEIRLLRGESPSNAISLIGSSGETVVGQDGSIDTLMNIPKFWRKYRRRQG